MVNSFNQSVLVSLLIRAFTFSPYCFSACRDKTFWIITCNMINAIPIQNNQLKTSKLESEKRREQINFWGLNFIFSLKMKKSNNFIYAQGHATDVDREIDN